MIAIISEVRRRSNAFRLGQAFVVSAAVAFLLTVVLTADSGRDVTTVRAGFELAPAQPGGPRGVVYLGSAGGRMTGTVAVWGLAPRAGHYAALRGPGGRCTEGRPAQVVAPLPRLVAGADGVAFARIDVPEPSTRFADGLAVTVHAGAGPTSARLACGVAPAPLEP